MYHKSFDNLKQALVEVLVLSYLSPASPYLLDTDACAEGLGAVLSQVKEGKEHLVAYHSAKFTRLKFNYCMTSKELLAVVKNLGVFLPLNLRCQVHHLDRPHGLLLA